MLWPTFVLSSACSPARASVSVVAPAPRGVAVVKVRKAPPPPRREVVVVKPTKRHVWIQGHHVWRPREQRWVWVEGRWAIPPRGKKIWVKPKYQRRHGSWTFVAGYWR